MFSWLVARKYAQIAVGAMTLPAAGSAAAVLELAGHALTASR